MKIIGTNDVTEWYRDAADLAEFTRRLGHRDHEDERLEPDLPLHLVFAVEELAKEREGPVPRSAFDSIPFYSLCKGLFLPLSGLSADRVGQLFGIVYQPAGESLEVLCRRFLDKEIGLSLFQKMAMLLGDPFLGKRGTFRRDSLVRLLRSIRLLPRNKVLDRLTKVGDVAVLFAEAYRSVHGDPPLTTLEVMETLRHLPDAKRTRQFTVLRSLFERCGKMEAYFLCKLLMRNAGFGFDYQGPLIAKLLAERFKVAQEHIENALALVDPIDLAKLLTDKGVEGLREIHIQPLSPVRPALASPGGEDIQNFPVWVERKYDGVRLLLHKATDAHGGSLCGAYTRNRNDWLEMIPGMARTIPLLPAQNCIVDGELYGLVTDIEGPRPASVYEVFTSLQGEPVRPVQLRYAAFDILYMNGTDLTRHPLSARRQALSALVTPLANYPLPIPIILTEGFLAQSKEEVSRLFQHFRAQGYEGIIAKDLKGSYHLAARDPSWVKRKPEITLDLVLLGGVFSVTSKETAGLFGSYVIGARTPTGGFEIVGDVAGVDKARDQALQSEVMRLGLLTGRRIERPSSSGVRPGLEFRPHLVATVKFEGIVHEAKTGRLSLRDPKIALLRADKTAFEADEVGMLEKLYLDQRLS
jgi:DNA ligase-1